MIARLDGMLAVDDSLKEIAALLNSASADLAEAVHALRRYAGNLNPDPNGWPNSTGAADMHRLARKHRVQPDALAGLLEQFEMRLAALAAATISMRAGKRRCGPGAIPGRCASARRVRRKRRRRCRSR